MSSDLSLSRLQFRLDAWSGLPIARPRNQRPFRRTLVVALGGFALCAFGADAQGPLSQRAAELVLQPMTQGPTQAEMDKSDVEPGQWLTDNKGYLGYRFSGLARINVRNVRKLKRLCSFKLGEQGSFQGGPLVYNGVLYTTSAFGTFAVDARACKPRWSYQHQPGEHMGQRNNKGAVIANGRVIRGTPDGHLIALDASTGTLLWDQTSSLSACCSASSVRGAGVPSMRSARPRDASAPSCRPLVAAVPPRTAQTLGVNQPGHGCN